jgi:hypothetical protein
MYKMAFNDNVEPKLKNYIIMDDRLICIEPGDFKMMPVRLFKNKNLLHRMHHKKIGNKKRLQEISFDLLGGRKTIKEVVAAYPNF